MIRRYVLIITILPILLLISSCKKELNIDKWQPDMLMPFVKGTVSMADLANLKDKTFTQEIKPIDIGVTNQALPVPITTISLGYVGPYVYSISDYFEYVRIDSASFGIDLTNVFPLDINKGTRIDFRSAPDTSDASNIVFSHTIERDIPHSQTYSFKQIITNTKITSKLYMYLQNFTATNPNSGNIVFDGTSGNLTFEIKFLSVAQVAINSDKEYAITDTSEIEFGQDTKVQNYEDSAVVGTLNLNLTNNVPINLDFQIYFFDQTLSAPIDSFYSSAMHLEHAVTDGNGDPTSSTEKSFKLPLTAARVKLLKTAKYASYALVGNTLQRRKSEVLIASQKCNFQAQLTGDVKIKMASFLKF